LEIILKVSRRSTLRFRQTAGHHDSPRQPLRNKSPFLLRRRAQEYCFDFRSARGEVSMEEFIAHAASSAGLYKTVGLPIRRFAQLRTGVEAKG
jgi:hypothetical protein